MTKPGNNDRSGKNNNKKNEGQNSHRASKASKRQIKEGLENFNFSQIPKSKNPKPPKK